MNALEIRIRPETQMLPAALGAVSAYASIYFENKKDVDRIVLATEEAINNVLSFSATSHLEEITVTAESADGEFTVCVLDKGLPGDYEKTLQGEDRIGLALMHAVVDEASVENLGMDGRRQKLVKYYSRIPEFAKYPKKAEPEYIDGAEISVRSPKKADMLEVSRAFYNTYGLTYVNDLVYYPDRFYAAVAKDQIHSTVAVDQNGRIAGHHGVFEWGSVPGIWESGMAVVDSRYRNAGVFKKMMARTFAYVRDREDCRMFLGGCTTAHPYSQKLRLKYDSAPCAFNLNLGQPGMMNSGMQSSDYYTSEAIAAAVFDFTERTVYLPEELHGIARFVYGGLHLPRQISSELLPLPSKPTLSSWSYNKYLGAGTINVVEPGADCESRLLSDIFELKQRGSKTLTLYISAEKAGLNAVYAAAKAQGFFITGILPNAKQGDVVVMQKMVDSVVDYSTLVTTGPYTELLEMIRPFDPDQNH